MGDIGSAIEKLTEELEEKNRRIRELQEALAEGHRRESAHRLEVSRLARAFQPASIRVWFWAAETRLTQYLPVGTQARDARGKSAGDTPFSEDHLLRHIHPEDRERLALAWDQAHEGLRAYDIEYRVVGDDGTIRYQHETATPEFDEAGGYVGHVGITQEISQQKLVEERMKLSANRLNEAQRIARIGSWDLDLRNNVLTWSDEIYRMFEIDPAHFGASYEAFLDAIHPDDREMVNKAYTDSLAKRTPYEITHRLRTPDGRIKWVHERCETDFDTNGEPLESRGTVQDITDLRRAEEEVRTRDAWLAGVLENTPIEIVLKDLEGRILAISRNVGEILGYSEAELIGGTSADFLPAHVAEVYMAADRQVMESGKPLQQEVREEVDGVIRYSLSAKFPLKDDQGNITGVCSLTSDITEIRQAEEQLHQAQKMEAVGQLTGGVAHDFNNLLAIIQGNTEILTDEVGRDNAMIQAILRASKRGAELTHRLLAFSRRQTLRSRPIDLAELVGGMTDLLKLTVGAIIEVETMAAGDLALVMADPGQLENALLNLAINARDAMPEGGKLTIECQNTHLDAAYVARNPEALAGDYVVLAVSDNGTGMSAEVLAQVFEPFFTTKEVGQGSGLGLSMVYGFVKQSGGHVTIYSEEGRGTTVKLYLVRAENAAQPEEIKPSTGTPQGRGEVILVIEDDNDVRDLAATMLERLGYRVVAAADAAHARSVFERGEKVDLVLSDVVLPGGMSGPEFAGELRQSYPDLAVIFMSGYPAEAAKRNGFLGSGSVLLNKPFEMKQLAKALREALD